MTLANHVPGERSSALYSPLAIACAQDWGLMRVDSDGLGWIRVLTPDMPSITQPIPPNTAGCNR